MASQGVGGMDTVVNSLNCCDWWGLPAGGRCLVRHVWNNGFTEAEEIEKPKCRF